MSFGCIADLLAHQGGAVAEIQAGHNTVHGGFAAVSLEAHHDFKPGISIGGGIQYNTIGKVAAEICPSYFHDLPWGRISTEILLHYANISSVNTLAAGAGIALSSRWIHCRAGYYFRTFGGEKSWIDEPFNIYYRFAVNCLPMLDRWDLQVYMTNCETFELERHYQPSFAVQGWYYPTDRLGVTLGLNCKPAGMFHLSADYYQTYIKAGICYRW